MIYPYLKDFRFLKEIDELTVKEQFVKIIILDWNESPIAEIQGRVSGGSLSLDGSSAVRRSGNITFITEDEYYNVLDVNNLISINKKIKIEIGYTNPKLLDYPQYKDYDKLWFPQGVFVIINPSITRNNQGLSISISFKDKMCLLNGECGGVLPAQVNFAEREDDNGVITRVKYNQIIRELVSEFGGEQVGKIIINDVEDQIRKVMKWNGSENVTLGGGIIYKTILDEARSSPSDFDSNNEWTPLLSLSTVTIAERDSIESIKVYGFAASPQSLKFSIDKGQSWVEGNKISIPYEEENSNYFVVNFLPPSSLENLTLTIYAEEGNQYITLYAALEIEKDSVTLERQKDVGYILTDFCPTGDLIGNAGQNVVTILDTIKKQLGNYEYFYDIEGNFVFQEIKNYLNTSKSTTDLTKLKAEDYLFNPTNSKAVYEFLDGKLISAYQNAPQYANVKNDFIVWGTKEIPSGGKLPIRYHLAFDKIPKVGNEYRFEFDNEGNIIIDNKEGSNKLIVQDFRTELYLQGLISTETNGSASNRYYAELKNEWAKLFELVLQDDHYEDRLRFTNPAEANLDYYLDIIEPFGTSGQFAIDIIGPRSKVWSENGVNCIFEQEPPEIILIEAGTEKTAEERNSAINRAYSYYQVPSSIYNALAGGGKQNSAFNAIRDILYQYTNYNESITLTALPIYYLEPNTRITVEDEKSNIHGDYMIKSITRPFDCNGTMNITATKALERF